MSRSRIIGWAFIALGFFIGLGCGAAYVDRGIATADRATYLLSDGGQKPAGPPATTEAWGRRLPGYAIHPAFPGKTVANAVDVEFDHAPEQVKAWFSQPPAALLTADGLPTRGDGVRIRVSIVQGDGSALPEQIVDVPQEAFLEQQWVPRVFEAEHGIARMKILVEGGPPGSNTFFDATLIGLKAVSFELRARKAGTALMVAIAFTAFAWWMVACVRRGARGRGSILRDLAHGWLPLGVVALVILGVGAWSLMGSQTVYYWDSRNYWQKTEILHGLLSGGQWRAFIVAVADAYAQDYSMFPALLPAAISLLAPQGPTKLVFGMTVIAVYALPAYLAVAWLGSRIAPAAPVGKPAAWILAALAVFFAMPVPMSRTLLLMPDIGGLVLIVLAWWAAATMLRACIDGAPARDVAHAAAMFGVTCAAMFLFRRWYVFAAIGLGAMAGVLLLVDIARAASSDRIAIVRRSMVAAVTAGAVAFPFLCWVVFAWSKSTGQHDYATLYASYRNAWLSDAFAFLRFFGLVGPIVAVIGLAIAWPKARGDHRRRWWLLVGGTLIAAFAFLQVQSPGAQHYNLLVPCLGAGLVVAALTLARRHGMWALVVFVACFALGNIATTRLVISKVSRAVFPGYETWLPRQMPSLNGYRAVGAWLVAPERRSKYVCMVASSSPINSGVLGELWQVVPALKQEESVARSLQLPAVDSRDGAPRGVDRCDIALVGDPFQTHLAPGQQDNVAIVREDLLSGRGIGAAFAKTHEFAMDGGVRLIAFERTRPITAAEIADLQQRWTQNEAKQNKPAP